jgi:hypothetical protein
MFMWKKVFSIVGGFRLRLSISWGHVILKTNSFLKTSKIDESLFQLHDIEGPNMIKYAKKVVIRKLNFKISFYSTLTFKKVLKKINLHFKILSTSSIYCMWNIKFEEFLCKKSGWKIYSKLDGCSNFPKYFYINLNFDRLWL